jgi:hypothetical protein
MIISSSYLLGDLSVYPLDLVLGLCLEAMDFQAQSHKSMELTASTSQAMTQQLGSK